MEKYSGIEKQALLTPTKKLQKERLEVTEAPSEERVKAFQDSVEEFTKWLEKHVDPGFKTQKGYDRKSQAYWKKRKNAKDIVRAFELWMNGRNWTQIAKELGVSSAALSLRHKPAILQGMEDFVEETKNSAEDAQTAE